MKNNRYFFIQNIYDLSIFFISLHKALHKTPYETVLRQKPHLIPRLLDSIPLVEDQQNEKNNEEIEANFSSELFQEVVEEVVVGESDVEEGPSMQG